jgi:hypothetical protein
MVEQGRTARGASEELDIVERAGQGMAVMVATTEENRAWQPRQCRAEQRKVVQGLYNDLIY